MALQDNLVAYYKLDGNSNDSVGSNNGTDTSISYVTGKINNCASFNGSTSYINLGNVNPGQSFSSSFWFKRGTPSGEDMIVTRWVPAGQNRWGVGFISSSNNLSFMIGSDDTWRTISVTDTEWHHVVITYNGTTAEAYFDGSKTLSFSTTYSYENTTTNIGRFNSGAGYYLGLTDEVGIWSRVLTSGEITQLYNSGAGLSYPFTPTSTPNFLPFFQHIYN